jgi:uncharacterized protein YacL
VAIGVLVADIAIRRKRLDTITAVYFGTFIGLILTYVLRVALTPWLEGTDDALVKWLQLAGATILCYTCISVLLQTKDDFRFIIPYVEFSKDVKGLKPYVLDTSVVIDGRIADIVETRVIDNQLVMPQFVIAELQAIADSGDKLKRNRGRRGLDILHRIQKMAGVEVIVSDVDFPQVKEVDLKLIELARTLLGRIVTNDFNLNKVAQLRGVEVLNINELANALKPVVLPGEAMNVFILKEGKEYNQGVAYLDDGTMVVVDNARSRIGRNVDVIVTSVLQTTAGRMIFGRCADAMGAAGENARGERGERAERDETGRRPRPAAQA